MLGRRISSPFGKGTSNIPEGTSCFNRLASFCSNSFLHEFIGPPVSIKTGFAFLPAEYNKQAAATLRIATKLPPSGPSLLLVPATDFALPPAEYKYQAAATLRIATKHPPSGPSPTLVPATDFALSPAEYNNQAAATLRIATKHPPSGPSLSRVPAHRSQLRIARYA